MKKLLIISLLLLAAVVMAQNMAYAIVMDKDWNAIGYHYTFNKNKSNSSEKKLLLKEAIKIAKDNYGSDGKVSSRTNYDGETCFVLLELATKDGKMKMEGNFGNSIEDATKKVVDYLWGISVIPGNKAAIRAKAKVRESVNLAIDPSK